MWCQNVTSNLNQQSRVIFIWSYKCLREKWSTSGFLSQPQTVEGLTGDMAVV